MLWLYLHFYQLQLDTLYLPDAAEEVLNKETTTANKPHHSTAALVIVDGHKNAIRQACEQAREQGIETGMGLATAAALVPQLQVIDYQPALEEQYLQELADRIYQVSANIVLKPPQGLLLEIGSMLNYHGGLPHYWQSLQQKLQGLQYQYSSAHSPLAAQVLAQAGPKHFQYAQPTLQREQLPAQLRQSPSQIKIALEQLHVTQIPIAEKTQEQLQRLGIRTLQRLLALPLKELGKRFDIELLNCIGRINNQLKTPLDYYQPKDNFEQYLQLFYEISNSEHLLKPLSILLKNNEAFLQQRDMEATQLDLILYQRKQSPLTVTVLSNQGDYRAERWQWLFEQRCQRLQLQAPVESIRLHCKHYRRRGSDHSDLFNHRQGQLKPQQLLDNLRARLGADNIQHIEAANNHLPELSTRLSQTPSNTSRVGKNKEPMVGLRPTFTFKQPIPLTQTIVLFHGPERIQTHWWQAPEKGGEIERDYFIARDDHGRWCWVFKTPRQQWYLQGYFS